MFELLHLQFYLYFYLEILINRLNNYQLNVIIDREFIEGL